MSTAKEIAVALFYLQSECYKAGYPETGYLVEVARLSLEGSHPGRGTGGIPAAKQDSPRLRA